MVARPEPQRVSRVLLLSAFLVATCGLVYELVAGALASYLLGDSVTQFSLVIGAYLSAMGVGAWLSRFVDKGLLPRFVEIEVAVALVGGLEAPILFTAFAYTPYFQPLLFLFLFLVGALVGLELPLLIRILEQHSSLKELVARVLFLDYIGALAASVIFPLFLVPRLGLFRTSLAFGLLNAVVALWTTFLFDAPPRVRARLRVMSGAAMVFLVVALAVAGRLEVTLESALFADPVVFRDVTPYQRIVVTHRDRDTRLFLNGALQFSSLDEYRYHESLVHPPMAAARDPRRVLVLGGGDGLAVREVLRHPVESVTLVDLDPAMTSLFRDRPELAALNGGAFSDPRVHVINADAFQWVRTVEGEYDVVIVDFPDPNNYALGKLYSSHFYRMLAKHLAPGAALSVQATSPFWSPSAFWCVVNTMESEGYVTRPYHAYVPSFGEWGFVLATRDGEPRLRPMPPGLKFLDDDTLETLFHFPRDLDRRPTPINRLDNQVLVRLYEDDWKSMGAGLEAPP